MFKKILIPTDGSPLSAQAANAGVCFARSTGAEVVALHVTQPFAATIGFDGMAAAYAITDEDYEKASAEQSKRYLKQVMDRAETASVKGSSRAVSNFNVADGIVQAATETGCDLIFIGSHGRSGLSRLLLGSVTAKVLSLAHVAVLVYRVKEQIAGPHPGGPDTAVARPPTPDNRA
jgi:nucleotide-binding universal stress UspA family protein